MAAQSRQIAEASRQLVEADAQARQQLIQAQAELQSELQAERASLGRQYEALEQERRQLAGQRHREPLVAAAITTVGLLLVCALPLVVAIYALRQLQVNQVDDQALCELIVCELTSGHPRLLPPWRAQLEHQLPAVEQAPDEGP
jgi:hypothetical protein